VKELFDLFDLSGKVALVYGGSRGIGEMIAEGYVANGVRTDIASHNAEACGVTAERLSEKGDCISIPADLSAAEGIGTLVAELTRRKKRLDIVVNDAGATWGEPIETFPEHGWDKVMDISASRLPTFSNGPSKAAVHHLARTLASHLAQRNITANSIAPGLFPSRMTAHIMKKSGKEIIERTLLNRACPCDAEQQLRDHFRA
jgi:NAD(P)-dependent dehydrogenase (short-subunit alcohol dehydrogenase family)